MSNSSPEGRPDMMFMMRALQQSFERMNNLVVDMNERLERQENSLAALQRETPPPNVRRVNRQAHVGDDIEEEDWEEELEEEGGRMPRGGRNENIGGRNGRRGM